MGIFSRRGSTRWIATLRVLCRGCRLLVPHSVERLATELTVVSVPLIRIDRRRQLRCTSCSLGHPLDRAATNQLLVEARAASDAAIVPRQRHRYDAVPSTRMRPVWTAPAAGQAGENISHLKTRR
jgi:hypothetical protein